jgi:hypothetical protein
MSWLGSTLRGIGQAGADVGTGAAILQKQKAEEAEQQLRQIQARMQFGELQARIQEQQQKVPATLRKTVEVAMGRSLTDAEAQRLFGVQPPAPKAKYTSTRLDDKGKLWGLNAETGVEELVPTTGEFQGSTKTKPSPLGKIDPIIAAQVGKPPDSTQFPGGEDDPTYRAKMKAWGVEAEKIKDRMAGSAAAARGAGYGLNRVAGYITPEGELVTATGGQAIASGYVPAAPGFQAMSKQSQFSDISNASQKLRSAISALQPGDAFNTAAVAQMARLMRADDPGTVGAALDNLLASGLNERQQDYVIWLKQMKERLMSIRPIAGMGQGSDAMRDAISSTLPSVASGNAQFALKSMDAVDNQMQLLYRGIPKVSKITGNAPATGDATDDAIIKALGGK